MTDVLGGHAGEPGRPRTVLLVIDVQQAFDDHAYWGGERNNLAAESNIARLLAAFRAAGQAVIHVRHASTNPASPLRAGHPGHQPKLEAEALPNEPLIVKQVNSAFIGTDLEALLRANGIGRLVVCGATSDHCVSTTVRMASNLGFAAVLVDDACWTYDRRSPEDEILPAALVHRVHLASLQGEFADVLPTAQILAEFGGRAGR